MKVGLGSHGVTSKGRFRSNRYAKGEKKSEEASYRRVSLTEEIRGKVPSSKLET